jgi:Tfp pilus assembly protein PilO
MPPGDLGTVIVTSIFFVTLGTVLILRGPVGKALARRLEGGSAPSEARAQALEERVARLEAMQDRLVELEERLDFAERLLAARREARPVVPPSAGGD